MQFKEQKWSVSNLHCFFYNALPFGNTTINAQTRVAQFAMFNANFFHTFKTSYHYGQLRQLLMYNLRRCTNYR